jgi:hypothetical protein
MVVSFGILRTQQPRLGNPYLAAPRGESWLVAIPRAKCVQIFNRRLRRWARMDRIVSGKFVVSSFAPCAARERAPGSVAHSASLRGESLYDSPSTRYRAPCTLRRPRAGTRLGHPLRLRSGASRFTTHHLRATALRAPCAARKRVPGSVAHSAYAPGHRISAAPSTAYRPPSAHRRSGLRQVSAIRPRS